MGSLYMWSMLAISFQTFTSLIVTWMVLECKLQPHADEYHEVTLIKAAYLYDPEACSRMHFYNYTTYYYTKQSVSVVMWATSNPIAASFRNKLAIWLALHIMWFILGLLNGSHGQQSCGFYAALLPFTLVGIALLILDIVHTASFITDALACTTYTQMLAYLNLDEQNIKYITPMTSNKTASSTIIFEEDTSWVGLVLAFVSCRGIVLWVVNFWIVKDNYFSGVEAYRKTAIALAQARKLKATTSNTYFT